MLTRRKMLQQTALATGAMITGSSFDYKYEDKKWLVGACDWSLRLSADPNAFELASRIGLSGIQVNLGNKANNFHLRDKLVQKAILDRSKETAVKISSLAIGELNNIPFKSEPLAEQLVWDSIDVAQALAVNVILIAFFVKGDLRNDEAGIKETIRRFKKIAPKAEKAGVYLGIESYLNADEHKRIIDAVGSPNIKVYYDFRNTADAGFDTIAEFKKLGPELICELHMKENGVLLGQGSLDWKSIAKAIKDTGYHGDGWMQIEWSMPDGGDIVDCYKKNHAFLKELFD